MDSEPETPGCLQRYPVLIMGVVQAIIAVVVAFGVTLTQAQTAAILGLTGAVLALVTHRQVNKP